MTRLTSEIWIAAYLTRLRQAAIPAFIVRKGDATAGAVLVKLNTLDGSATCFQRSFDLVSGERQWGVLAEGPEAEVDRKVSRQREFDPDIWVVEVEDRTGRHMLGEPGLT